MSDRVLVCNGQDFAELADELLGTGCQFRFCARGSSMHPFIQDGDVLIVEPLNGKRLSIGDVLLCRGNRGHLYAHRLLHLVRSQGDRGIVVTKGDGSAGFDRPIDLAGVLGRVVAIESGGSTASLEGLRARLIAKAWSRLSPRSAWLRLRLRRHRWLLALAPRPK